MRDIGAHFWKLFGIYAGVSAGLPFFSLIGLLREGIMTSQVWFESLWLLAIAGYDGYLVKQQTLFFPDFEWWAKFDSFQTPYVTIGKVFEVVTVVTLLADFFLSLGWACFLLKSAWSNRLGSPTFLFSDAQRLPWLAPGARPHRFTSVGRMLFGRSTLGPSPIKAIVQGVWGWFFSSTMFRRFGKAEPISYPILRGTVALLFWIILFAYGILSCVINPITQFNPPRGKATRVLTKDSRYSPTWGHVSGFVALGIIPSTQISTSENPCMKGQAGIQANYTDPLTNQGISHASQLRRSIDLAADAADGPSVTSCMTSCSYTDLYRGDDWFLQPEVYWDCGAIWDSLPFKTAAPTPNTRPYVTVTWDPKASTNPIVAAGLLSLHPDASAVFASVWFGNSPGNAHEWAPGLTFNFTSGPGLAYKVDVGRRKLYASKVTFLDLIGVPQDPDAVVAYPILSVEPNAATTNNQSVTTLEFHAGFGAYNDEIYEEYIEHTVLFGLATSGGLYMALNVLYVLLFGRSLLVTLFGERNLGP
ncbi:hypothetical protein FRB90_001739 [Tulasnella sp. 427]|nr:hypothetical protein FRB90_001739 [Tulasnella sp. 427]